MTNRMLIKKCIAVGCLLMIISTAALAQPELRSIAVIMEQPKQHIPDFTLVERLNEVLSMYAGTRVIVPAEDSTLPPVPDRRFDLERLIKWGQEAGVRYVVYLQVDHRKIVTAKKWSIPLILSRYVIEGQIDGAYSLIDIRYRKLISTWNLETRVEGPQQWQALEDYPDDPDLRLSAPRKITFLRKLEDLATADMIKTITPNLRGR